AFRVEFETAILRDDAITPPPEVRVPMLSGTAQPWDFNTWHLAARNGFSANLAGAGERPSLTLAAQTVSGAVSLAAAGRWTLWLRLGDGSVTAADRIRISSADTWIIVPPKPPQQHTDTKAGFATYARQVQLPADIGPLGDTIDELSFGATIKGAIPSG